MLTLNHRLFANAGYSLRSFEEAGSNLETLPRFFLEPDGAFLWRTQRDDVTLQLEGTLIDRDEALYCVEIFGTCTDDMLAEFLSAVAPEGTQFRAESPITGEIAPFPPD